MDTRRELGKFTAYAEMMNVRMVVGGDARFHGLSVILFELSQAIGKPFPFYETMEEVALQAILTAQNWRNTMTDTAAGEREIIESIMHVEMQNDRSRMLKAHKPNLGPYSGSNPKYCLDCGKSERQWVEGECCVPK